MVRVLFLCPGDSSMSRMAEGFAHSLGRGFVDPVAASMGSPAAVDPLAVRAMKEIGIRIGQEPPPAFDQDAARSADIIVTICGDRDPGCPALKRRDMRHIHLQVGGACSSQGSEEERMAAFRRAREAIGEKVNILMGEVIGL